MRQLKRSMNKYLKVFGNIIFYLIWPGLFFYIYNSSRCRIIIIRDNQLLLVKNWIGPREYTLPGGGFRKNETPMNAAVREIMEETGIKLKTKSLTKLKPVFQTTEKKLKYNCYSYIARINKEAKVIRQKFEISEIKWVNLKEVISKYPLGSTSKELIATWLEHNHLLD